MLKRRTKYYKIPFLPQIAQACNCSSSQVTGVQNSAVYSYFPVKLSSFQKVVVLKFLTLNCSTNF